MAWSEIQQFGKDFCSKYLATASSTTLRATSGSISTTPTASMVTPTSSTAATSTPSQKAYLGAGMDGTNWHRIQGETPDHNRGPAIEAVCITLLVIAGSVFAFRYESILFSHHCIY